ncbi:MAG: hypothetical protein ABI624_10465 [Casimicrobiaceae bacterium]
MLAFRLSVITTATVLPSTTLAQVVAITFSGGVISEIPLAPWWVLLSADLLLASGVNQLRKRPTKSGLPTWVALSALLASMGGALVAQSWEARAAAEMDVLRLASSPAQFTVPADATFNMVQSGSGYGFDVQNDSGRMVEVTGRAFSTNPGGLIYFYRPNPPIPTPERLPGVVLQPGEQCFIWIAPTVHW